MFQVRENRKPHGSKKLIAERRAFFEFMKEGMTATAASRAVGINERIGRNWCDTKVRSIVPEERSIRLSSCRYLGESNRIAIAVLVREGKSLRHIART